MPGTAVEIERIYGRGPKGDPGTGIATWPPLWVFGQSYAVGGGEGNFTRERFTAKTAGLLGTAEFNKAVGGAVACWHEAGTTGDGGYARVLQQLPRPSTEGPYVSEGGIVVPIYGANDLATLGSENLSPFEHALRVIISRARAARVIESSDGAWTYSGTWATATATDRNSGTGYRTTTSAGAYAETDLPDDYTGEPVAIGVVVPAATKAVYTIAVNGVTHGTLNTDGAVDPIGGKHNGAVYRITTGLEAGDTIRVTVTSLTTQASLDYLQIEAADPETFVVVPLTPRFADYSIYTGWPHGPAAGDDPINDAAVTVLNNAIRSVVAEFGDTDDHLITPNLDLALNKNADYFDSDGAHPNDKGHGLLATLLFSEINDHPATVGERAAWQSSHDQLAGVLNVDQAHGYIGIGTEDPVAPLTVVAGAEPYGHVFLTTTDDGTYVAHVLGRDGDPEGLIGIPGLDAQFFDDSDPGDTILKTYGGRLLLGRGTKAMMRFQTVANSGGSVEVVDDSENVFGSLRVVAGNVAKFVSFSLSRSGAGNELVLFVPKASGEVFDDSLAGDAILQAPSGRLLLGTDTGENAAVVIDGPDVHVGGTRLMVDQERAAFRPTGSLAETFGRGVGQTNSAKALTSGTLVLEAIWLPAGVTVSTITFVSSSTALSVGSNQWFALYSSARAKLGVTNDDTSAAWAAQTPKTLTLAAPYVTTAPGVYYLGALVVASVTPTLAGINAASVINGIAPIISGNSSTGLTNPASAPSTATAITATGVRSWAYVS